MARWMTSRCTGGATSSTRAPQSGLPTFGCGISRTSSTMRPAKLRLRCSSSSTYEAAWPPIGPPRTRTLGNQGAMPKRSSCSGLAAKQVVVVGVRGRAPFHLAGCLGAQELSHGTPSSTHLLCCRVAIARWLRCDPPCAFSISITVPCTPVRAGGDPIRIVSARLSGVDCYGVSKRSFNFRIGTSDPHTTAVPHVPCVPVDPTEMQNQ